MKLTLFLSVLLFFAFSACADLNKNEMPEAAEKSLVSAAAYIETGEEKNAFTGFYPDRLRGLGSDVYIRF
ncbi:MAG: hypothetical protein LUD81_00625, partial [Clostridiales bacterium]|nr:hypothetical protein [Clostridiales bacterium]